MRRCFVISPIGAEGSEIREHADDVFDFIIAPAMKELGIEAYRADHITSAGKITEQMFESLITDDLCVAILTFHNPNVFYELAVAQSAARPTVIMIEKGTSIPFDLRDLRAIEYDFKPRQIRDGVYIKQLVQHVQSIDERGWKVDVPFGASLSPLGGYRSGLEVYDDLRAFGGEERWYEVVGEAKENFSAAGISMSRWTKRRFLSLLVKKAEEGCKVRIMVMDPENPSFPPMINQDGGPATAEHIRSSIAETERIFEETCRQHANVLFKQIKHCSLHQQIVLSDTHAVVRPYLYYRSTSEVPVLRVAKPSHLFDVFNGEFDALWHRN